MKKTTSKNIIIKLFKINDKEKILEVANGRMNRGTKTRMTANFPLGGKKSKQDSRESSLKRRAEVWGMESQMTRHSPRAWHYGVLGPIGYKYSVRGRYLRARGSLRAHFWSITFKASLHRRMLHSESLWFRDFSPDKKSLFHSNASGHLLAPGDH